jgi:protein-S-isoprenylcysteine O-methyltransferase Ste14
VTLARLVFSITLLGEVFLAAAFVLTIVKPSVRVWPPPSRYSWQFRYVWGLNLVSMLGGFALGVIDWNSFVFDHWLRFPLGLVLAAAGLTLVSWGTSTLSMHTTLGLEGALIASGAYRYSRNPQYIGYMAFFAGYALICNSTLTWIVSLLGIALFGITPFAEEPWLHKRFGERYEDYMKRVPRFLGAPRRSARS